MNKESLKRLASERNISVEELEKYREYSSRDLTGKEWIEYLKLCEKVFKNTSKYVYIYENEIKKINEYIKQLQQENKKQKEVIGKAIELLNNFNFKILMDNRTMYIRLKDLEQGKELLKLLEEVSE